MITHKYHEIITNPQFPEKPANAIPLFIYQCLSVCPGLFQCMFHFPYGYLCPVIGDGIDFHEPPPSFRDPFNSREPFQGSLADIVSGDSKDDSGVIPRGGICFVREGGQEKEKDRGPEDCHGGPAGKVNGKHGAALSLHRTVLSLTLLIRNLSLV